jgi:hypothetical protein
MTKIPTRIKEMPDAEPIRMAMRLIDGVPYIYEIGTDRPIGGVFSEQINLDVNSAMTATVSFFLEKDESSQ